MPDSDVMTFTDPDAFYANMRRARVEGVVTRRGEYRAESTRIDLHRLWMQRGVESLPRVLDISTSGERPAISTPNSTAGRSAFQGVTLGSANSRQLGSSDTGARLVSKNDTRWWRCSVSFVGMSICRAALLTRPVPSQGP